MQIVIECNEYVVGAQAGNYAVDLMDFRVEVKCLNECMDLANKAVHAALDILKGEKT